MILTATHGLSTKEFLHVTTISAGRMRLALLLAGVLLALGMAGGLTPSGAVAQSGPCWTTPPSMAQGFAQWTTPPAMVIDPAETYTATIETNRGTIVVQLLAGEAPITVNNFVCLSLAGYYDVTVFHRIISGFMIQGGDPTGTGSAGPGYQFADELPTTQSPYTRGTMAMANSGPNTNGSQFFIVHQDQPATFPNNYSIFGRVTEGMDVVDTIAASPVTMNARGENSSPLATIGIKSITITDSQGNVLSAAAVAAGTPDGASPAAAAVATTVPTTAPAATVSATETPAAAAATDDDGNSNAWLWAAGGIAVLAGLGYWFWTQRRKPAPAARGKGKPTAKSSATASSTAKTTSAAAGSGDAAATAQETAATQQAARPNAPRKKSSRKR
jgi:cyclophilin family peptidyl-prolyl cis-trans isomerase